MMFAVQCKASKLYLVNMTPCRAAIEISPVVQVAIQYRNHGEAAKAAESMRPLFGSFDWQAVKVQS